MPETNIPLGSPVKDFIANTLNQIREGIKEGNGNISSLVDFDLNITEVKTAQKEGESAGINGIPVIVTGGKELANVQRVQFKAVLKED